MGWIYISNLKNLDGFNLQLNKHYNCIVHRQKVNRTTQTLFVQLKVFIYYYYYSWQSGCMTRALPRKKEYEAWTSYLFFDSSLNMRKYCRCKKEVRGPCLVCHFTSAIFSHVKWRVKKEIRGPCLVLLFWLFNLHTRPSLMCRNSFQIRGQKKNLKSIKTPQKWLKWN